MHAKYDFPRNDIAILELKTTVPVSWISVPSNEYTLTCIILYFIKLLTHIPSTLYYNDVLN